MHPLLLLAYTLLLLALHLLCSLLLLAHPLHLLLL
jgi:hypothetical protein